MSVYVKTKGGGTHHVIEAGRGKLGHHSLGKGVVRSLEEPKDDVVEPSEVLLAIPSDDTYT